jgi:hypothetical protein
VATSATLFNQALLEISDGDDSSTSGAVQSALRDALKEVKLEYIAPR